MLRNTSTRWGRMSRGFHWLMVLMIAIQLSAGFILVEVYEVYKETYADDTWVMRMSMLHNTLGFLILMVAALRLNWRLISPRPELPASLETYQRHLAKTTHVVLYALMFIYPLSGWAALSSYELDWPIFFFGWDDVPRLVPQVSEDARFGYDFFAGIHRTCWKVGGVLVGLHIIGALWHQFVAKDNALRRMLREQ